MKVYPITGLVFALLSHTAPGQIGNHQALFLVRSLLQQGVALQVAARCRSLNRAGYYFFDTVCFCWCVVSHGLAILSFCSWYLRATWMIKIINSFRP